jgi:intracellular sulfur oxidation DsrE/DsrF family protein
MSLSHRSDRRGFVARGLAAAAAGWSTVALRASGTAEQAAADDSWIKEVPGTHRCFFDFPTHGNGWGLAHVNNYLTSYAAAYKVPPTQVGAVGTFYGIGPSSSIALGFNDAMWARYGLGEYLGLEDAGGRPYTRNVFHRPTAADGHLLAEGARVPTMAPLGGAITAAGIEGLQTRGTKFLMCANALGAWTMELEARGKGAAAEIGKDLRANLLPGVTIVPAMVVAIEQAQAAGIRYNRQ